MESTLLLDRLIGRISTKFTEQLITESLYYNLDFLRVPKFPIYRNSSINTIDFDRSEGKFLLSGSTDSSIHIFQVDLAPDEALYYDEIEDEDDEEIKTHRYKTKALGDLNKRNHDDAHNFGVTCTKWWPFDTGMFLSSSYDGNLKIWDSATLSQAFQFELDMKINNFDISKNINSSLICVATESSHARILDIRTTSAAHTLTGHHGSLLSCKWNPRDPYVLATGSSEGEIKLWDIRMTRSCTNDLDLYKTDVQSEVPLKRKFVGAAQDIVKAHSNNVNGLEFLENGQTLVSTGTDDKIRVWNLDQSINTLLNFGPFVKNKKTIHKSMIVTPIEEMEVQYLLYPSDNGEIIMYRMSDGKLVTRLRKVNVNETLKSQNTCLTYCGFNSAVYLSGTSDGRINAWGNKRNSLIDVNDSDF